MKLFLNKDFIRLASNELSSSLSKTKMINRVKRFLPSLNSSDFKQRGRAGIRSLLIDKKGNFASESMLVENESSLHILNYNSPGATGAMPFAANIVKQLIQKNIVNPTSGKVDSPLTDEA